MEKGEFENYEQALHAYNRIKGIIGQKVRRKDESAENTITDIKVNPFTWYVDGNEEVRGFDLWLILDNGSFVNHRDLQAFYKI